MRKYIGTEHFLLALLREDECLAAPVLGSCGITLAEVRAQVIRVVGEGTEPTPEQIPFTKHAVNVTNLAQQEARSLDNEFIGTEHVLLGLVSEREGRAAEILGELDAGAEKIREEIIRMIGVLAHGRRTRAFRQGRSTDDSCSGVIPEHWPRPG